MLSRASYVPVNVVSLSADPEQESSRLGDVYYNTTLRALRVYTGVGQLAHGFGRNPLDAQVFGEAGQPLEVSGWVNVSNPEVTWDELEKPPVVAAGADKAAALATLGIYLLDAGDSDDELPVGSVVIRRRT
jgi:hypothetical protein